MKDPGHNILVIGASSGVGLELVRQGLGRSFRVWGVARSKDKLQKIAEESRGQNFRYSALDITLPDSASQLVRELNSAGYSPDTVYLCVGSYGHGTKDFLDPEYVRQSLLINYSVHVNLALALMGLKSRPREIIYLSSIFALLPDSRNPVYSAAKAAGAMAFRGLALKEHELGTRFKVLYLGPVAYTGARKEDKRWYIRLPEDAAGFLLRLYGRKGSQVFYPWFGRFFAILMRLLPVRMYSYVFEKLRR